MNRILSKTLSILIAATLAAPAWAQDYEEEAEAPGFAQEAAETTRETAELAEEQRAVEDAGEVTYDQVLADPDNIDLNYRYAKRMVALGDLRGAAATLERILMINPALPKVRLFYAIVLYRLDNLPDAERELNALKALPMPDSLRAEIDEYLDRIEKARKRTTLKALAGIGFQFDDNRSAFPSSGQSLIGGAPAIRTDKRRSDTSVLFLLQAGVEHDPGFQAGHTLFADLTHYRAEQTLVDTIDLQAFAFKTGAKFKHRLVNVSPAVVLDHIRLSEETYLRTRGVKFDFDKKWNNTTDLYLSIGNQFQEHVKTTDIPTAEERTGPQVNIKWGASFVLNPKHRLSAGMGFTRKEARKAYWGYDRKELQGQHAWLLGKGRFLLSSLTIDLDRYHEADRAIDPLERNDDTFRLASTFGMPMGWLAKPLKDLLWTVSYEYFHSNSNILNYAYTNNKINTMFTYKWDYSL